MVFTEEDVDRTPWSTSSDYARLASAQLHSRGPLDLGMGFVYVLALMYFKRLVENWVTCILVGLVAVGLATQCTLI